MPFKDPEQKRKYQRKYKQETKHQTLWMAKRRERAIKLLGGECAKCGSTKSLEVDHIDPSTKDDKLRRRPGGRQRLWTWAWSRIEVELTKCQVLCEEHHKEKSATEKVRGERTGSAKLTEDAVRKIRLSSLPNRQLARQYGVDPAAIRAVKRRQTWRHVE